MQAFFSNYSGWGWGWVRAVYFGVVDSKNDKNLFIVLCWSLRVHLLSGGVSLLVEYHSHGPQGPHVDKICDDTMVSLFTFIILTST
jgi:hypothetical protein